MHKALVLNKNPGYKLYESASQKKKSFMNLALNFILYNIIILRVCLFEGEIRWMENFGKKKIGKKTFLKRVWLDGERRK